MKRFPKKIISILIFLAVSVSLAVYVDAVSSAAIVRKAFDEFAHRQFCRFAAEDTISLHYYLKDPGSYGIEPTQPTLGKFSAEKYSERMEYFRLVLEELELFDYKSLDTERRITFDIIKFWLMTDLEIENKDLFYYTNVLSLTSGVQAELPILFAEYKFYGKDDADDYLALLDKTEEYFTDILLFEQQKSEKGLFMSDFTADAVIEQCREFAAAKEDNYLIETFDSKIEELDITNELKTAYKNENRQKIIDCIIPAYNKLADGLAELKGTGINNNGLCYFENGKRYYEYLAKTTTGSDKSVDVMTEMVDASLNRSIYSIMYILQNDPSVYGYLETLDFGSADPAEILLILKRGIESDFPTGADGDFSLKYVHPSMENSLSPAFYMIPPIDDFSSNVIYINKNRISADSLFTTLAHEGYPGHLYQTTYFYSKNPNPVRRIFDNSGFVEGWAVYAELYSYFLADFSILNENLSELLYADAQLRLAIHTRADIGINYNGWTEDDLNDFLTSFGISDRNVCRSIFEQIIQDPGNFLRYYVGYLEIQELLEYASDNLGDRFIPRDFNRCLLDIGPAPFPIVRDAVHRYVYNLTEKKPLFSSARTIQNKFYTLFIRYSDLSNRVSTAS